MIKVFLITIILSLKSVSQALEGPISNDKELKLISKKFIEKLKLNGFSGAIYVSRKNNPIIEDFVGYEDFNNKKSISLLSKFRLASLTKQFTSTAVLLLAQKNKINLHDKICNYIKEFCLPSFSKISIHHLLSHTSGLPRISKDPNKWTELSKKKSKLIDFVNLAVKQKLLFRPGTDYKYSNFGYRILSYLIEKVSNKNFSSFMRDYVFITTGLKNTYIEEFDKHYNHQAEGKIFVKLDKNSQPVYKKDLSGRLYSTGYGSGGAMTTIKDLSLWSNSLDKNILLNDNYTKLLFRPNKKYYAYGWQVKKSGLNKKTYQTHSGANQAYFSELWRIPIDNLLIIILGNIYLDKKIEDIVYEYIMMARGLKYKL